jgi:mono/diheme cytochrome c family protein
VAVVADDPPGSGAEAYQAQCASCHLDISYEDMRDMLPGAEELEADPAFMRDLNQGMILATILELRDQGETMAASAHPSTIDPAALPYPYMPPFVGTDDEAEALAAYLTSLESTAGPASADEGGA